MAFSMKYNFLNLSILAHCGGPVWSPMTGYDQGDSVGLDHPEIDELPTC